MADASIFNSTNKVQWCPGCGNFGILTAVKKAISTLGLKPHEVVVASGIGCSSKIPHYIKTYGFEGIHGRGVPAATGIHLSNHNLKVIAMGGDGDGFGIGLSHFLHAARRNLDITYIVHDNNIYGLTKGQASPTTPKERKTTSTPHGNPENPLLPIPLAISAGATFVARGYAGDIEYLSVLMKEAMEHKGFSFIDVLQPCVSYNPDHDYNWYQERVYKFSPEYELSDKRAALSEFAEPEDEKIPVGVFFKKDAPVYTEKLPQIRDKALADHDIGNVDITGTLKTFL